MYLTIYYCFDSILVISFLCEKNALVMPVSVDVHSTKIHKHFKHMGNLVNLATTKVYLLYYARGPGSIPHRILILSFSHLVRAS